MTVFPAAIWRGNCQIIVLRRATVDRHIVTPSTGGLTLKHAIGYLRASTSEQGRSGLGLAAQRHDIETFSVREGFLDLAARINDVQFDPGRRARGKSFQ